MYKDKKNLKSNSLKNFDGLITICAYDAGAANHLIKIYSENLKKAKLCLDGPALKIFEKHFKEIKTYNLEESLKDSRYLISGTGWSSSLEHNSRKIATKNGIFNIAIIDHWVNYLERFIREEELILPDEIWVTDNEAEKIASNVFPKTPIIRIPNFWMEDTKSRVINGKKNLKIKSHNIKPSKLLYLTEPIRSKWGKINQGEFQSMRYFFENLHKLSHENYIVSKNEIKELIIKLHPSEESSKYDDLIKELKLSIPIKVTKNMDLSEALIYSEACFGCETQALVVSLACGLPTFSVIPPWGPTCRLPHNGIIHLKNIL